MLAAVIANVSGKTLRHSMREVDFLPDFLQERKQPIVIEKSLEQQHLEFVAFKEKLQAAQGKIQ